MRQQNHAIPHHIQSTPQAAAHKKVPAFVMTEETPVASPIKNSNAVQAAVDQTTLMDDCCGAIDQSANKYA